MIEILPVSSREELKEFLSAKPKAILGFHAYWLRDSSAVVELVLHQAAAALTAPLPTSITSKEEGENQDVIVTASEEVVLGLLDVGLHEDLAFEADVSMLPCFNFYRDGRLVDGIRVDGNYGQGNNGENGRKGAAWMIQRCLAFVTTMEEDVGYIDFSRGDTPSLSSTQLLSASTAPRSFYLVDAIPAGEPLNLFIAGDRSKVGKSSVCLALLGSLLRLGFAPGDLAYIKPATQCEAPQLVTAWCDSVGIANRGIGPVVFYKGFTREFLKGNAGTSADLLREACEGVRSVGTGKKIVLVDGVGYPAVGSICGISNADIARALGACPVLLVGRSGVGDAVDSFNLHATFFRHQGVKVLGAVFNRLPLEGFYSLAACREAVGGYFAKFQFQSKAYGFLPEVASLGKVREEMEAEHAAGQKPGEEKAKRMEMVRVLVEAFREHVDLEGLLQDAWEYRLEEREGRRLSGAKATVGERRRRREVPSDSVEFAESGRGKAVQEGGGGGGGICAFVPGQKRKSRGEIEQEAKKQGAKGG